jgi:hypothetical protein
MYKLKQTVLMLCFILSGALCYAHGEARTVEKEDGVTVTVGLIEAGSSATPSKGNSIIPTLNGHVLTVVFTENLGQVSIEITTSTGGYVQTDSCLTPNGIQFYIPLAGDYIITFTLPNGDVYAGEFTVTD